MKNEYNYELILILYSIFLYGILCLKINNLISKVKKYMKLLHNFISFEDAIEVNDTNQNKFM